MKTYRLDVTLVDGASFSRDAGSTGDHRTLDRIPGANLWGLVCSALYARAAPLADRVAHGGEVLFGDAYPLSPSGALAWPAPLCLHYDKTAADGPWHESGRLCHERVFNGLHFDLAGLGQARAVRHGYVSGCGEWVVPATELELSTAIESTKEGGGRAAENTLHGQASLRRHRSFRAEITVGAASEDLQRQLEDVILDQLGPVGAWREVTLGRGKGVHFGRARVRLTDAEPDTLPSKPVDSLLTLWLLSDACLRDAFGRPTLQPDGTALGLPEPLASEIVIDPSRCFVRHRSHSAYNRHRGCHGLERQSLEAGSVLSFKLIGGNSDQIRALLRQGIGTLPELGFGRVWVDAPMLAGPQFEPITIAAEPVEAIDAQHPTVACSRNGLLVQWAQGISNAAGMRNNRADWVGIQIRDVTRLLEQSRRYAAADEGLPHGPGRSQWGQVEQIVRDAQDQDAALEQLFTRSNAALAKRDDSSWHVETGDVVAPTPAAWWQARIGDAPGSNWVEKQQALCLLSAAIRKADPSRPPVPIPAPAGATP